MKRWYFLFLFLIVFSPLIEAGSVGISPTHFDFFFEPELERTFTFNVVDADSENLIESYVAGDLTEYVTLSETEFVGSGSFDLTLKLPKYVEKPGKHRILVGVRQKVSEGAGGAVKGVAAVQAVIDVYVPYPGKYIEAKFELNDVNEGENASYFFEIDNLGTENIVTKAMLSVSEGADEVYELKFEDTALKSKKKLNYSGVLDSEDFEAGIYDVEVLIDYGKILRLNETLRVGNNFVNLTRYDYRFESGKINRINLDVENLWNSEMEGVYFTAAISDQGKILDQLQSASQDLKPWEKTNLTGFIDATNISEGKYLMSLNLFYSEDTTSKLVYVYFSDPPKDYTLTWIIAGASLVAIILLLGILFLSLRLHKLIKRAKLKK